MMNSIKMLPIYTKWNVDQQLSLSLCYFFFFNDGKGRSLNELYIDQGLSLWARVCPP
jgi:hypothetical protein